MLLQVEGLQKGMLSHCHMGFIFLESDLNVLKALNNNKKMALKNLVFSEGNEEDIVFCTHSVGLTCVFPSRGNLVFP